MKSRVLLLAITIVAVTAMAFAMSGCSCDSKKEKATTINPKDVPTAKTASDGQGGVYIEDNFESISPTEKTTDDKGNTVITYTNAEGNKVTKTISKDGTVNLVIKDKKGKVIKKRTYKETVESTAKSSGKNDNKKETKKNSKKKNEKESAGAANDSDGRWSEFY